MAGSQAQVEIRVIDDFSYRVYPGAICGATDAKHRPSGSRTEVGSGVTPKLKSMCKACGENVFTEHVPEDDTRGFWTPWATTTL